MFPRGPAVALDGPGSKTKVLDQSLEIPSQVCTLV